jgi:hypothetical protein
MCSSCFNILCHIDLWLGKDLKTNNEKTAFAMQKRGKHDSTTVFRGTGLLSQGERCDANFYLL